MVREQFYSLASFVVNQFLEQKSDPTRSPLSGFREALRLVAEDESATIEERAAILEFDANLPRDKAERTSIALSLRFRDS